MNIYRQSTINKINDKLKLLNCKKMTANKFMNYRLLSTSIVFLIFILFTDKGYIYAPLFSIITYILFEYILNKKIEKRKNLLNFEAIFYFQVLILTLESGKDLQGGIELTCKYIDSEISDEFKKTLNEIKLGKSLIDSLNDMKQRIPSEEINTVILNITQSSIFGNNVIESLNNQIEYLSDKKMLSIKAKINKMPMKISVTSVVFMIPIVLLLILGPVLINYLINS